MAKRKVFHDITMELTPGIVVYPGDPPLEIKEHMMISKGDLVNLSVLTFGSHTGTHVDAPRHFFNNGKTVDQLTLDYFLGEAKVFEIQGSPAITIKDVEKLDINKGDIVLFKTCNSTIPITARFQTDFTYITAEAASYLAEIGIRTLGIDYLSIDDFQSKNYAAHYTLLGKEIVIIEGLVLRDIHPGNYQLVALPLNIKGGNGSPVRAVLIEEVS